MVDKKSDSHKIITSPLSDETIDELGYARITSLGPLSPTGIVESSSKATPKRIVAPLTVEMVAGPTKSPPPVLMPRPRPAVHPTLKLTNAFANSIADSSLDPSQQNRYHQPLQQHSSPQQLKPTLKPHPEEEEEHPEKPPSTYVTPPLPPLTMKPLTPKPSGSALPNQPPTPIKLDGNNTNSTKGALIQESSQSTYPRDNLVPTTTSSAPSSPPVQVNQNSNLNHQIVNDNGLLGKKQKSADTQSALVSSKEEDHQLNSTANVLPSTSSDNGLPVTQGFLARKPLFSQSTTMATVPAVAGSAAATLPASTSAPVVPSPLVKSTLASQLSNSSKSTSSSSSTDSNISTTEKGLPTANKSFSTPNQTNPRPSLDQLKHQQPQQHRNIRKSMSTEQLIKPIHHHDLHSDSPFIAHSQHPTVEKLLYGGGNGGGKTSIQQLQQEYLLRQNGYLRRQVDALRVDNMESQRQHQELISRMKQLEVQLLEKRQPAAPVPSGPPTMNEYQHHHYYHHNVFDATEDDQDVDEEEDEDDHHHRQYHRMQRNHHRDSTDEDGLDQQNASPQINRSRDTLLSQQTRRPGNLRRHSTHATPSTSNPPSPPANRRQRQRHVTAPSLHHYGKNTVAQDRQNRPGSRITRPRSRSVPKSNAADYHHAFPPSHYRPPPQQHEQWMYRSAPTNVDEDEDGDESMQQLRYHHYPPPRQRPPPGFAHAFELVDDDDEDEDDSDDRMELMDPRHFGDRNYFYAPEEEDYLDDQDYYHHHHMAAPGPPPPPPLPSMFYYPPSFDRPPPPPPPDAYFNDPYAPPLVPPLTRRKSASGLRPPRGAPPALMEFVNQQHYGKQNSFSKTII